MNDLISNIVQCEKVKEISQLKYEIFVVLYIFPKSIKGKEHYDCMGTKNSVRFPNPNSIINYCLENSIGRIILLHNHPSFRSFYHFFKKVYSPEPSDNDIKSTQIFSDILNQHGISILDHIIVCPDNSYFSFKQNNIL